MARITPTTITGGYASIDALNDNFVALSAEFEKCVYRDGEATNSWTANQDANSKRLLNLPDAVADSEPATYGQLQDAVVTGIGDHGTLTGLADDDHAQYFLGRPTGAQSAGYVLTTDGAANYTWQPTTPGVTDHGALTGLIDDDHSQYMLVTGTRRFSGSTGLDQSAGAAVFGLQTLSPGYDTTFKLFTWEGGTSNWVMGGDFSASGDFKISNGDTLGTNDVFTISSTTGAATFSGSITAQDINVGAIVASGNLSFAATAGYILGDVPAAEGDFQGITQTGVADAALSFGELVYRVTSNGRWAKAKADVAATSSNQLGVCVQDAAGAAAATNILVYGKVRADTLFDTFTVGAPVYISAATAGKTVTAAPTGTTDFVVRKVGFAEDGNTVFFTPSNDYITLL